MPMMVVVVLSDPFCGMGTRRNSAETQQSGHTLRSRPNVKNRRSSVKEAGEDQMQDNPGGELVSAGAARSILPFYPT